MGKAAPPVTVGIPVFNGERFLPEALASARTQTFADLEILISDNGSTDATEEICRAATREDGRIRYMRHEVNRGGVWNFNNLVAHARGRYFKWAAADDVMLPRFIETCTEAVDDPGVVLSYPRTRVIDAEGTVTEDLNDAHLRGDCPTPHQRLEEFLAAQAAHLIYGLFQVSVLRTTRGMRPTIGNDVVLLTEMACRGRFALVPERLFLQRRHSQQFSAQGADQVSFHAPLKNARFDLPQTKVSVELLRGVASSPIGAREKRLCVAAVTRSWTIPRWRGPAGDVRRLLLGH